MQPGDYDMEDIETLSSAADAEFAGFGAGRLEFYRPASGPTWG